ncbi:MAG: hypothetical protein WDN01_18620 [Rhizomicrobium sp.]
MTFGRQLDLFRTEVQPGLLEDQPARAYRADPDEVRRDLHKVLAEARAAKRMPWTPAKAKYRQTVFPQMCDWLPEAEAAQLRLEFEAEMTRLAGA